MNKNPAAVGVVNPRAAMSLLWTMVALTLPGIVLKLTGFHPESHPLIGLSVFGLTIVAAAFLLTWAAEVAEIDIGSGLAVVFLALVTVLPEYAVDIYLAWEAGTDPHYQGLALANMTGANRLLIGIGWPVVALMVWYRENRPGVVLMRRRSGDIVWLLAATIYSLAIPLKGDVAWYDAVVLFGIYAVYVIGSGGHEHGESVLVGPPRVMGAWPRTGRRRATTMLFVWSAGAILASAEPFSESLIAAGAALQVDRYFLIQWLAPLASEAPEFVVVILLTMRGRSEMGLAAFLSSKVNQWTLLVGAVPLAFGLSRLVQGHGYAPAMAVDAHQTAELWLTATQGLYAVAAIADLHFGLGQALVILGLFLAQFVGSLLLKALGHEAWITPFHNGVSVLYALLALERFVSQWGHLKDRIRDARAPATAEPSGAAIVEKTPDESDA